MVDSRKIIITERGAESKVEVRWRFLSHIIVVVVSNDRSGMWYGTYRNIFHHQWIVASRIVSFCYFARSLQIIIPHQRSNAFTSFNFHSILVLGSRISFSIHAGLIISFFFHARNEIKSFVKLRDCRAQNVNRQCDQNPVKLLSDLSFVPEAYFTHTHTHNSGERISAWIFLYAYHVNGHSTHRKRMLTFRSIVL